jgi:hypothetical protein
MDTYALEKLTGWTPELSPPPDSPLYRARTLAGDLVPLRVATLAEGRATVPGSHSGAREARTRNLEIPGLVLRTIPE